MVIRTSVERVFPDRLSSIPPVISTSKTFRSSRGRQEAKRHRAKTSKQAQDFAWGQRTLAPGIAFVAWKAWGFPQIYLLDRSGTVVGVIHPAATRTPRRRTARSWSQVAATHRAEGRL